MEAGEIAYGDATREKGTPKYEEWERSGGPAGRGGICMCADGRHDGAKLKES